MKKFARIFTSSILKTTLFVAALTAAIASTFGSPEVIKNSLDKSGFYDNVVSGALQGFEEGQGGESREGRPSEERTDQHMSLDRLETAAQQALPPDTLKSTFEQIVDNIYSWLKGDIETPDFRIDLSDAKARFITAAGGIVENHVAGLPVCTAAQSQAIDVGGDVFEWECRPTPVTPQAARTRVESELHNNEDFLKDPVISAEKLKNKEGQSLFTNTSSAPDAFQLLRSLPWILLTASLVLGAVVIALSESQRLGFKHLAMTLAGTGVFLLLTTWLLSFLFDRAARPEGLLGRRFDGDFQASALEALRTLNGAFSKTVLIYSLAYIAIGGVVLLALRSWTGPAAATIPADPEGSVPGAEPKETDSTTKVSAPEKPKEKDS